MNSWKDLGHDGKLKLHKDYGDGFYGEIFSTGKFVFLGLIEYIGGEPTIKSSTHFAVNKTTEREMKAIVDNWHKEIVEFDKDGNNE